jgi:Fic family protein
MTSNSDARVPRPQTTAPLARSDGDVAVWPAHEQVTRPWRQTHRRGTVEDRKLREVPVSLPPFIAGREVWCSSALTVQMEASLRAISTLDSTHGEHLAALGMILLRTESVASSKIEHVEADVNEYARALYGVRSNPSAVSMAAATEALDALIGSVDGEWDVTLDSLLRAHRALMRDDQGEQMYAGRLRDMQNWIGGSDHSPRNALYVPPPPETVGPYLADLVEFANRLDVPVLAQAAVAHAQFESIHPFTDGNGRIGRALVNTILRRRGATTRVVVPLASALVARRDQYFDVLGEYREGRLEPIISAFASASSIAARESRVTADRVAALPAAWADAVGPVRVGSAIRRLLDRLTEHPVFSAEEAEVIVGGTSSAVYRAIDQLRNAEILRPLSDRKRNQIWGVADMLDELDDLGTRIATAARRSSPS